MKVLITGSSGLLGSEFVNYCLSNNFAFQTIPYSELRGEFNQLNCVFDKFQPNVVIHCAANTDVEWCETNKHECYRDNVLITEKLCNLSQLYNCKFVFFSSTGVYGDKETRPYSELDEPNPSTVHHQSKFVAENKVQNFIPNCLILRVGWLFGGNPYSKKNFIINRINEFNGIQEGIFSNFEQYGSPTYVLDVVDITLRLIDMKASGIFNCVNVGFASRYEYVKEIGLIIGSCTEVKPVTASSFSRVANVSNNEMAINEKLNSYGINLTATWQSRLREYIGCINENR